MLSLYIVLLPMFLMLSYSILLPPLIFWAMFADIRVKGEGYLHWHLDSCGILLQRFVFSLLVLVSLLSFSGCIENPAKQDETGKCIADSLIPLLIPLLFVLCKITCLKK